MVPQPETISSSDEDDFLETLDDDLKQTDEYKELMELKKKLEVTQGGVPKTNRSKTVHHGFTVSSFLLLLFFFSLVSSCFLILYGYIWIYRFDLCTERF